MVDNPTAYRWIFLPDASGTLVVAANPPLYVDQSGTVSLLESSITSVGNLNAGSLARGFGETPEGPSHQWSQCPSQAVPLTFIAQTHCQACCRKQHTGIRKMHSFICILASGLHLHSDCRLRAASLLDRRAIVKTLPG